MVPKLQRSVLTLSKLFDFDDGGTGSYEKTLLPSTKLHVVISQKTAIFILAYYARTEENHEQESE